MANRCISWLRKKSRKRSVFVDTFKTVHLKQLKGMQSSTVHLSIEGIRKRYLFCQLMNYYILYSLPVFALAESLQLILEIGANFRLVSYLLADN